jgi:hypothetical protein
LTVIFDVKFVLAIIFFWVAHRDTATPILAKYHFDEKTLKKFLQASR